MCRACRRPADPSAELYREDFLPNCFVNWVLAEQERLRSEYETVPEPLIDLLLERRQCDEVLRQAKT